METNLRQLFEQWCISEDVEPSEREKLERCANYFYGVSAGQFYEKLNREIENTKVLSRWIAILMVGEIGKEEVEVSVEFFEREQFDKYMINLNKPYDRNVVVLSLIKKE